MYHILYNKKIKLDFKKLKLDFKNTTLRNILETNTALVKSAKPHPRREEFFDTMQEKGLLNLKQYVGEPTLKKIKRKIASSDINYRSFIFCKTSYNKTNPFQAFLQSFSNFS